MVKWWPKHLEKFGINFILLRVTHLCHCQSNWDQCSFFVTHPCKCSWAALRNSCLEILLRVMSCDSGHYITMDKTSVVLSLDTLCALTILLLGTNLTVPRQVKSAQSMTCSTQRSFSLIKHRWKEAHQKLLPDGSDSTSPVLLRQRNKSESPTKKRELVN